MAYQPKSYRKFLAGTVTAAVVASAVAPAASAAFTDVSANDTHAVNVNKAVQMGLINGYPDGTFGTYQDITRGQVAKIIARYLGNVDTTGTEQFTDVANSPDTELKAAALKVRAAGVFTGSNGALNAGKNITRQEMATVVARLFELTDLEDVESKVTDNDKAWEVHRANINILSENGVTTESTFNPLGNVKRGQFASFFVRAIELTQEVKIEKVTALDATGRYVEINFSTPVVGLEAADIQITDAKTGARKGVKDVKLSSNGKTATVELFSVDEDVDVLTVLRDYTVKVYYNGETLQYTFNRPAFVEASITSVSSEDKEIEVGGKTLKVKDAEFDYQNALGRTARVWYNQNNELVNVVFEDQEVKYDALKVTKVGEVKLVSEDKKYDVADEDFLFYVDGELQNATTVVDGKTVNKNEIKSNLVNQEYDFAKVVFNEDGDVESIHAYNWNNYLVVDSVENDTVIGVEGTSEFDAEDAVIVKDGKEIALSDLEAGDVLFFNTSARDGDGFGEVLSNTVTGEIENVFNTSIEIDGKQYDYINASPLFGDADYTNEDGEVAAIDSDAAEQLQAAGEVTLYLDRKGNLVYVGGDLADVASTTYYGFVEDAGDIVGYKQAGRDRLELTLVDEAKASKLYDLVLEKLDTVTIDGTEYELDENPAIGEYKLVLEDLVVGGTTYNDLVLKVGADDGNNGVELNTVQVGGTDVIIPIDTFTGLINVELDDNENVEGLEFFTADGSFGSAGTLKGYKALGGTVKADAKYAEGKLLSNSTLVFVLESDGDVKNITTWGELEGTDITAGSVYFDKENKATVLVASATDAEDVEVETVFVDEAYYNVDDKLVRADVFLNGEKVTLTADKLGGLVSTFVEGAVAQVEINESTNEINKVLSVSDVAYTAGNKRVSTVDISKKKVTFTDTSVFTLVSDGYILDATDLDKVKVESSLTALQNLSASKRVTVVYSAAGFAEGFIITSAADTNNAPTQLIADGAADANEGAADATITATTLAADVDVADTLTVVAANSSNTTAATVSVVNGSLVINYADDLADDAGNPVTTITVDVTDGTDTITVEFDVTVTNVPEA